MKHFFIGVAVLSTLSAAGQIDTSLYNSLQIEEVVIREEAAGLALDAKSATLDLNISRKELKKAACCNLSESFETNPSIDVSFTDAVTGTKQIQLFGLAGKYAQIQVEMTPLVRGLLANSGLSFIPGTWVQSIQLTKGIGAVNNGPESMTGQINVELLKPEDLVDAAEAPGSEGRGDVLLNGYLNQGGRFEFNEAYGVRLNDKWMLASLGHFSGRQQGTDMNGDGFLDNPLGYQVNGMLRARYFGQNGWEGIYTFHALEDVKQGGQMLSAFAPGTSSEDLWSSTMNQGRVAFTAKTGWVNPDLPDQSVGTILQLYSNEMDGAMGNSTIDPAHASSLYGLQNGGMAQVLFRHGWGTWSQTSGLLLTADRYDFDFVQTDLGTTMGWLEVDLGLSTEWTYAPSDRFTAVLGARYDWNSIASHQVSPRIHLRWEPVEKHTLRLAAGRGFRNALPLVEEWGRLATNRNLRSQPSSLYHILGGSYLNMEEAYNTGLSYAWNFKLNYMPGSLQLDAHSTVFGQTVVQDYWTPGQRYLYTQFTSSVEPIRPMTTNTPGASVTYQLNKRTEMRLAYRFQDLRVVYRDESGIVAQDVALSAPFVPKHRLMAHLSREFKGGWTVDATLQRYGEQPIPGTDPIAYPSVETAPAFNLLNGQIRKAWAGGDIYLGVENGLNVRQANAIDGAVNPQTGEALLPSAAYFQTYFDATRIWGPIFGRMVYLGTNLVL
jgi:outer membrane receptor for ferrienterochelin and colicins